MDSNFKGCFGKRALNNSVVPPFLCLRTFTRLCGYHRVLLTEGATYSRSCACTDRDVGSAPGEWCLVNAAGGLAPRGHPAADPWCAAPGELEGSGGAWGAERSGKADRGVLFWGVSWVGSLLAEPGIALAVAGEPWVLHCLQSPAAAFPGPGTVSSQQIDESSRCSATAKNQGITVCCRSPGHFLFI